jgi:hypothetical protein
MRRERESLVEEVKTQTSTFISLAKVTPLSETAPLPTLLFLRKINSSRWPQVSVPPSTIYPNNK